MAKKPMKLVNGIIECKAWKCRMTIYDGVVQQADHPNMSWIVGRKVSQILWQCSKNGWRVYDEDLLKVKQH